MKSRESGMPPEKLWLSFFDANAILLRVGLTSDCECVVDFGCGYGTFSIPAASIVRGTVYALDVDPKMIEVTREKAERFRNVKVVKRDFIETGCGLPDAAADYVMVFNILHAEEATVLLCEARRVLKIGGKLGVMHWNYDPSTPRGPSMGIRLRPEQCQALAEKAGFDVGSLVDLPPYHYGFVAIRA